MKGSLRGAHIYTWAPEKLPQEPFRSSHSAGLKAAASHLASRQRRKPQVVDLFFSPPASLLERRVLKAGINSVFPDTSRSNRGLGEARAALRVLPPRRRGSGSPSATARQRWLPLRPAATAPKQPPCPPLSSSSTTARASLLGGRTRSVGATPRRRPKSRQKALKKEEQHKKHTTHGGHVLICF